MATVEFRQASRIYDPSRPPAVSRVSLDIADGEFLVLVGPSGCGKSTTLRMLAGLEPVDEGQIFIDGVDVTETRPRDRDVAMVFQSYALYPNMTARQNMAFALQNAKVDKATINERVDFAAKMLELEDLIDKKPAAMSGGQRQRVAMGRAIVRQPKVFLFDEPLSNLDAKLRIAMRVEIRKLQRRLNTTSIYVTHDQLEAMTLADRLVVLNAGRIEQIGTPLEVYRKPASTFVAGFIGSPAMNLVSRRAVPHLPAAVQAGTIGIRPEDLSVAPDGPIEMEVLAVEELGAQRLVHGQTGGERLTVALPSDAPLSDRLRLSYRPGSLHLFHPETGRRID